jgi:hypothetical protein
MLSVFDSSYHCEQLYSLMKNVKSRTMKRLPDKHLDRCMRIATTEIKSDIEGLFKQTQWQISH